MAFEDVCSYVNLTLVSYGWTKTKGRNISCSSSSSSSRRSILVAKSKLNVFRASYICNTTSVCERVRGRERMGKGGGGIDG